MPEEPQSDLDALVDYMQERFPTRKEQITKLVREGKELRDPSLVIRLAYEVILFRFELDEWLPFAKQLLEQEHGNQLSTAHSERDAEARERKAKKPDMTVVKTQAQQFVAPLKRAHDELRLTHDFLSSVLIWCQSQAKLLRSEEYDALAQAAGSVPSSMKERSQEVVRPPNVATALTQMQR